MTTNPTTSLKNLNWKVLNPWTVFKYCTLLVGSLVVLIPPVVVFFSAFKTKEEYLNTSRVALPESFLNWANFEKVLSIGNLDEAFGTTLLILSLSLIGNTLLGSMVAYILGRFDFKLKNTILGMYVVAMLIPMVTTQVATFQVINGLGLYNTIFAPIVMYLGADVMVIYIFLQFVQGIPKELDEAARLDGASYFRIYWSIILPLLKPAIVTVVIIRTIYIYNDFYIPFLYMPSRKISVVSTALYKFMGPFGAQWNVISAGVILVLIPTIVLFLVLQRYIYAGVTGGAVKG